MHEDTDKLEDIQAFSQYEKTYIPARQEYFDEHGEKIRVLSLKNVKKMGGKLIPTILEMIPLDKKNHKTTLRYIWVEFIITCPI